MKIAVCIRQVPSTETRIAVSPQSGLVDLKAVDWLISPYDEYALEEALRIRERIGGSVTAVGLGPERVRNALKTALATGADEALLVSDPALEQADSRVTARVLAEVLRRGSYDIVLCGQKGVDDDMGFVGPGIAEFLDLPCISAVTRLELDAEGRSATAHCEVEGAVVMIEARLPAVILAQKGLNEPRYPTLRGMMLAGRKETPKLALADLGLDPDTLRPVLRVLSARLPPERRGGRILEAATPQDGVRLLVRALREEAKVI